jgi:hypothetical protein
MDRRISALIDLQIASQIRSMGQRRMAQAGWG